MEAKWIALFLISPILGLLTLATVWKYVEVWRARSWIAGAGRVVSSRSVDRVVKPPGVDNGSEQRQFADVSYEFNIGNQKYKGTRVTIGEDLGNSDVAETLIRYPAGKNVTVYYNPNDPKQCVLERNLPKNLFQIMIFSIAALLVGAIVVADGLTWISNALQRGIPNPKNTPFVIGFSIFALFCAMMARAIGKQRIAAAAPPQGGWILWLCVAIFTAAAYWFATTTGGKV